MFKFFLRIFAKKNVMAKIDKRIEFLAEKFDIFMDDEMEGLVSQLEEDGCEVTTITSGHNGGEPIAILYVTVTNEDKGRVRRGVKVHENIFASMIAADPTPNKIYLQWMLTVFTRLIKDGQINDAIRFGCEDLPQANEYLELFDGNKRKRLFKELSTSNYALMDMEDPTNINQYKSLSQLFDAVDPFIERDPSDFERAMKRFVDAGHAEMPVRDRNFTLFIPLTRDANVLFNGFASWCTVRPGNGMFDNYTNYSTPTSKKSKIYIIIDNRFLEGDYDEARGIPNDFLYQIHFESQQLRDRSNGPNKNIYDSILSKSEALSNFFYKELKPQAQKYKGSLKKNMYVDYLIQFGFTDILFDMLDENQPSIRFKDRAIPTIPSLKKFKNVEHLFLGNTQLRELSPTISELPKLGILSVPKNKLTSLPREIGKCRNLTFMNLLDNPIKDIPQEIAQLDESNGGKLYRISVRKKDVGEENYERLRKLLPNVMLTENEG